MKQILKQFMQKNTNHVAKKQTIVFTIKFLTVYKQKLPSNFIYTKFLIKLDIRKSIFLKCLFSKSIIFKNKD